MKGSVTKVALKGGSTRWRVRVDSGPDPSTGKRRQKERWFERKAEAERWLADHIAKVQRGDWTDPGRTTVGEYVERWYASHRGNLSPRTAVRYRYAIDGHVLPGLGAARLASLRPSDVRLFFERLRARGRRDGRGGLQVDSLRYIRAVLHQALAVAVADGLIAHNPAAGIRIPQPRNRPTASLTPEQVAVPVEGAQGERLEALVRVLVSTGLRLSEATGLRWEDVDLDKRTLAVRNTVYRLPGRGFVSGPPKTSASARVVDLSVATAAALRAHRRRQTEERLRAGAVWQDRGLVFCREDGAPPRPEYVRRQVLYLLLARLGLPRVRVHDLRHTHATLLLAAGENPKVVQERLGHSDVTPLLRMYSHVLPGMGSAAAERFDALINGRDHGARARRTREGSP